MRVRLTFHGPNTSLQVPPEGMGDLGIGETVIIDTELADSTTLTDAKRFWDMEHTFNELTKGRLHVELTER